MCALDAGRTVTTSVAVDVLLNHSGPSFLFKKGGNMTSELCFGLETQFCDCQSEIW